tara:strand:+ start:50 stop:655 length:606 start_codon:yes stop_codon:yes gene_type:complete
MIGFKKEFIFLHIPRTGGTSIESFLQPHVEFPDQETNHGQLKHYPLSKYYEVFGKTPKPFYKFTVVRNPWDRMVSYYFHLNKEFNGAKFEKMLRLMGKNGVMIGCNFSENIEGSLWYDFNSYYHWMHELKNEKVKAIRFENLQDDFNKVCEELDIEIGELPHINKTKKNHYSNYYNKRTKEMVEKAFSIDINTFGYKYETI